MQALTSPWHGGGDGGVVAPTPTSYITRTGEHVMRSIMEEMHNGRYACLTCFTSFNNRPRFSAKHRTETERGYTCDDVCARDVLCTNMTAQTEEERPW